MDLADPALGDPEHVADLGERRFREVASAIGATQRDVVAVWEFVKSNLNPYPTAAFTAEPSQPSGGSYRPEKSSWVSVAVSGYTSRSAFISGKSADALAASQARRTRVTGDAVTLGGCSSMQDKSSVAKSYSVDDAAYIAQVEHTARDRGVSVHWVNPPKKRVASQL